MSLLDNEEKQTCYTFERQFSYNKKRTHYIFISKIPSIFFENGKSSKFKISVLDFFRKLDCCYEIQQVKQHIDVGYVSLLIKIKFKIKMKSCQFFGFSFVIPLEVAEKREKLLEIDLKNSNCCEWITMCPVVGDTMNNLHFNS